MGEREGEEVWAQNCKALDLLFKVTWETGWGWCLGDTAGATQKCG